MRNPVLSGADKRSAPVVQSAAKRPSPSPHKPPTKHKTQTHELSLRQNKTKHCPRRMRPLDSQVVGHFSGQNNFFSRLSLKVRKMLSWSSGFLILSTCVQGLHSRGATHRVARVQRVLDRVCRRISLESAGQHEQREDLEVESSGPHGVRSNSMAFGFFFKFPLSR